MKLDPYVMKPVRIAYVQVIGKLWLPAIQAAQVYDLTDLDLYEIGKAAHTGELTRDLIQDWLARHGNDFASITDFHAQVGEQEIPWSKDDSEDAYDAIVEGYYQEGASPL